MDFAELKKLKDELIENYDYSIQRDTCVWFYGVQLKKNPKIPFIFADVVVFDYETNLRVYAYQNLKNKKPFEIK